MTSSGPIVIQQPDWVIMGAPLFDGGVVVVASKEMNQADVSSRTWFEDVDPFARPFRLGEMRVEISLTAKMVTAVMVKGTDYADALRKLFELWAPEDTTPPGHLLPLREGRKVIEG